MSEFTLESAEGVRRAIGELVRAVRLREDAPEGQLETLGFLAREGALSIASLARRRRIRHQSMSSVVAELEDRGLVSRSPDPADARCILVVLTAAGAALVEESRLRRAGVILSAAREALTMEEREALASAPELLDKLVAALRAG